MATPYVRIHEAVQEFLVDRRSLGRAEATIRFYRTHPIPFADSLSDLGTKSLGDLSRSGLRGFFAHLRRQDIAHNTVAAYDRAIRVFLRFCVLERYMERDLMKGRPRIRQSRGLPETWDDDEITALLDTCEDDATDATRSGDPAVSAGHRPAGRRARRLEGDHQVHLL